MVHAEKLIQKFFRNQEHPYKIYERKIEAALKATDTLLDAGCGRSAPVLRKFREKAASLIGVDLEPCSDSFRGLRYIQGDIANIALEDSCIDVVISRAVLEHVKNPLSVFEEVHRILKPGGSFIFLIPNLFDYASLFSILIPNRFHGFIVSRVEGRKRNDVFPVYYRANTFSSISCLCRKTGFKILEFEFLGQYPAYFTFNPLLFVIATAYEKVISRFEILKYLRGWILVHLIKME